MDNVWTENGTTGSPRTSKEKEKNKKLHKKEARK